MNDLKEKYNEKYLRKIDKKNTFIPLTRDYVFKAIMTKNVDIFKDFLIETMDLNITEDNNYLIFLDKELIKGNFKEKGKTIDLNVRIGEDLIIDIEMNTSKYEVVQIRNELFVSKLNTLMFEVGDEYKSLRGKYIYQLNLNANPNEKGDIEPDEAEMTWRRKKKRFSDRQKIFNKYLVYYKNMYYNKTINMTYDEIFMAGLMSNSFTELYDIMKNILSTDKLNNFMESVINMSKEWISLHEWEKEKMDKMVAEKERELELREYTEEMIKKMIENNADYDFISKVTNKSTEEIKEIAQSID